MVAMSKEHEMHPQAETKRTQVNISPSAETYENVKRLAAKYGMSLAEVAREIVKDCASMWEDAMDAYRESLTMRQFHPNIPSDLPPDERMRALFFQYSKLSAEDQKTLDAILDIADKVLLKKHNAS
jgi:hypothetical protein